MNQEAFFNLLRANNANLPVYGESAWKVAATRARTDNHSPTIFTTANIGLLLADIDFLEQSFRFVIDAEQTPRFGFVGAVRGATPGHEEMSNRRCLAAGLITVDPENPTHVLGLSSESGFFKPDTKSLIWPLKYLLSPESVFTLPETLAIRSFDENAVDWSIMSIEVAALRALLINVIPHAIEGVNEPYATFPEHAVANVGGSTMDRSGSFDALNMLDNQPLQAIVPAADALDVIPPHAPQLAQHGLFAGGFLAGALFDSDDEALEDDVLNDEFGLPPAPPLGLYTGSLFGNDGDDDGLEFMNKRHKGPGQG